VQAKHERLVLFCCFTLQRQGHSTTLKETILVERHIYLTHGTDDDHKDLKNSMGIEIVGNWDGANDQWPLKIVKVACTIFGWIHA